MHRLVCRTHSLLHLHMVGWGGDMADKSQSHLFADADFGGCTRTLRLTSSMHLCVRGPRTSSPISGHSERQMCVSHSTREAEIVMNDAAVTCHGVASLYL